MDDGKRDDAKKNILARRAKFVAAALAGVACGKEPVPQPQPCLSIAYIPTDADAPPQPCLSISIPADAGSDDASAISDAPPPPPQPCLSVRSPDNGPPPHPCLSPVMPPKPKP